MQAAGPIDGDIRCLLVELNGPGHRSPRRNLEQEEEEEGQEEEEEEEEREVEDIVNMGYVSCYQL